MIPVSQWAVIMMAGLEEGRRSRKVQASSTRQLPETEWYVGGQQHRRRSAASVRPLENKHQHSLRDSGSRNCWNVTTTGYVGKSRVKMGSDSVWNNILGYWVGNLLNWGLLLQIFRVPGRRENIFIPHLLILPRYLLDGRKTWAALFCIELNLSGHRSVFCL